MKIGFRIWILIIALSLSLLAISPSFQQGVVVKSVDKDSKLFEQGLRTGQVITSVNGILVKDKQGYVDAINDIFVDDEERRLDITTKSAQYTILTNETPNVAVDDVPSTNIKTGLDLRGGARALVSADQPLTDSELEQLVEVARNRFNVYGLSDVEIKGVSDLEGNKFMLIEVAGATPDDLQELVAQQGKFEAKIGNDTVFVGGKDKDISDICRNDATCAGVQSCQPLSPEQGGGYFCNFAFTIYLTQEAAQRHADLTADLLLDETGQYLSERLFLFVDEEEVDSLLIGSSLRGQVTTQISIQGSGQGATNDDALRDAREEMNRLQTILITGSLPYKLKIEKLDTISPTLGQTFTRAIILAGIAAIVLVSLIVFVRYRKFKASLALLLTAFSELFIILGVAALIGWNLDLPSIAGILATVGTGVDQQIVILDEATKDRTIGIRQRLKRALFIIFTAYMTSLVSLLPLYWAGAGLFRGFAFTTIIGITAGVLITRPAFADIIRRIEA
jgi:preprotein translocase subunit SecD